MMARMPTTRLAPSPTGALHLGNARTFLVNWAIARQRGWRIVVRIEDLDGPRVRADAAELAIDLLGWLGLDWDEGPHYQTHDLEPYIDALTQLRDQRLIYPCRCTRSQILAASLSAPHGDEHELRYSGACRPPTDTKWPTDSFGEEGVAWRLITPDEEVAFTDHFHGPQSSNPQQQVGDFLVAAKSGMPSYQLAVVLDDHRQGVDQVVRGDDLLGSTARQILLYRALGFDETPEYTHLPLVLGPDGLRLAKRHGDTRLDSFRSQGVTPERVIGLLAAWSGAEERVERSASEFMASFDLNNLPSKPVVCTLDDVAWLTEAS